MMMKYLLVIFIGSMVHPIPEVAVAVEEIGMEDADGSMEGDSSDGSESTPDSMSDTSGSEPEEPGYWGADEWVHWNENAYTNRQWAAEAEAWHTAQSTPLSCYTADDWEYYFTQFDGADWFLWCRPDEAMNDAE